jgi:hypothetical protein
MPGKERPMSAKQEVLDTVRGMPDGTTWDEILAQIAKLVAHRGTGPQREVDPTSPGGDASARFSRRLHPTTDAEKRALEADLDAMAADPDIQRELRQIEREFARADWDGMEGL